MSAINYLGHRLSYDGGDGLILSGMVTGASVDSDVLLIDVQALPRDRILGVWEERQNDKYRDREINEHG